MFQEDTPMVIVYLTHFSPMSHFYTPWKTSENLWFYTLWGIEM